MIGELIGGVSKLIGGYMNQNAQENANAANQAQWQTSQAYQHLANTHNIQWKVADAKAAGLHPLAALGVQPAGGPASAVGVSPETGMGDAVSGMGQDISRALRANETQQKRSQAFDENIRALDLENRSLQNEFLRSRIAKERAALNPAIPEIGQRWLVPGQGDTAQIKMSPFELTPGEPGKPWMEPGAVSDLGHGRTTGGYAPVPSKQMQERIEDNWLAQMAWAYRNQILPTIFKSAETPPGHAAPEGYEWRWNAIRGEYRPARRRGPWGLFKEWK